MLKSIAPIMLALGLVFGINAHAKAEDWKAGDPVMVGAYCNLASDLVEGDMKEWAWKRAKDIEGLIAHVNPDLGWQKYAEYMRVPDECGDARVSHIPAPVSGKLLEKLYEFEFTASEYDNDKIEFWIWQDKTGQWGLTWLSPKE